MEPDGIMATRCFYHLYQRRHIIINAKVQVFFIVQHVTNFQKNYKSLYCCFPLVAKSIQYMQSDVTVGLAYS